MTSWEVFLLRWKLNKTFEKKLCLKILRKLWAAIHRKASLLIENSKFHIKNCFLLFQILIVRTIICKKGTGEKYVYVCCF